MDFPEPTMAAWRAEAEKALKGADFLETLYSKSADGIEIAPLYEQSTLKGAIPGRAPATPWRLVQKMDHTDPAAANSHALDDLMNGATGLAMCFADAESAHGFGLELLPETFDAALSGVDLSAIHLRLEPGPRGKRTQELFADYCKRTGQIIENLDVSFGLDAIGAVAHCGTMRWPFEDIQEHMRNEWQARISDGFTGPFFEADGRIFHDAGASEAQELAITLANGVAFFRALGALGDLRKAANAIGFTLSADADQFMTIAKFRALRLLWRRIEEASGLERKPIRIHGETSFRMLSKSDPNTNMLRIASAVFGAGIGGADSITVTPHTAAAGLPAPFARRIARNVQSMFLEESNLYRVSDPAAGSGAFEALTDQLAETAWSHFQEIEATGGIDRALVDGLIHGWIEQSNAARAQALSSGEKIVLGVSLHAFDGSADAKILDIPQRPELVITKGALTIEPLKPKTDEALLGEAS
ncbi:MAG: methylmalonyl-CoA mutase family protein [Pseudomonadota bacterium]